MARTQTHDRRSRRRRTQNPEDTTKQPPTARASTPSVRPPDTRPIRVGQKLPLTLGGLATGGEAVARVEGFVVFVERGAPGDEALVAITEVHKNWARGRIVALREPSANRVEPRCPVYATCGGCQLQHLSDAAQQEARTTIVREALRSIGHLGNAHAISAAQPSAAQPSAQEEHAHEATVRPCRATESWGYRNKMQLVAGLHGTLGLYRHHTHKVVPLAHCAIAHPLANRILTATTRLLAEYGWSAYDEQSRQGLLRHVLTRIATTPPGSASNVAPAALVALVATSPDLPAVGEFARRLTELVPEVHGIVLNLNPHNTNVILGTQTLLVRCADHIVETVRGVSFRLDATSFFQVNSTGLATMADLVMEALEPLPGDHVVDAYCGVGALALLVAPHVGRVTGLESHEGAVEDARQNANLNRTANVSFMCGPVEEMLGKVPNVDSIILDPPRKGCAPSVLETIAAMKIERVVYVSCNPATLARDLSHLVTLGYCIRSVQPLDMFGQTSHVECVVRIDRDQPRNQTTASENSPQQWPD